MNLISRLKTESFTRGMWLSVVFNILAKGILFLLTILLAAYFGSNIKTDIYFFVYGSMVLLAGFINAIDHAVLIPQSMRLRQTDGDAAAMAFLNYFFRTYIFIGLAFVVLMYFFGTRIFGWMSKFSETDIELYRNYFLLGSCYFFFLLLTNYINAILSSLKYFTIPMIISGINSCVVIAGILLLHNQLDVLSVFISGIAAFIINLILVLILMKKKLGWKFRVYPASISKKVWQNIGFAELGQMATMASSFLPLFILSGFGSGVVSLMNYGKNIADVPNSIITAQITSVSAIELNERVAKNDHLAMQQIFLRTGKILLNLLVPISFFLFLFAQSIVQLFYVRGNFGLESLLSATKYLKLFSITIVSIGINALVARLVIAIQAIRQSLMYQVIINLLLFTCIWVFSKNYGPYGYPYAVILMGIVNVVLLFFMCKKLTPGINYLSLIRFTVWLLVINALLAIPIFIIINYLLVGPFTQIIVSAFVYFFALWLIREKLLKIKDLH